jgi:N6-adenosine-specific RNA methylase IME4
VPQHWRNVDMAHSVQNDLSQNFVTTGQRPQNFVCDNDSAENEELAAGFNALVPDDRYGGDPEFAHFARLKRELVEEWSARTPYMAHRYDLRSAINNERELTSLLGGYEFDVIVVDPPWKEYQDRAVGVQAPRAERAGLATDVWSLQELKRLPIGSLAAEPCLLFLWCGSGPHLAEGQQLMSQWGFKQVENICWLQTNKSNPSRQGYADDMSIFQRTHEHCLMGIRGEHFVMRDRHMQCMPYAERMESGLVQFVHPGVDIDCIVSEAPPVGRSDTKQQAWR